MRLNYLNKSFPKFILWGILNTFLSRIFLILMMNLSSVGIATFLADIFHALNAYFISSKGIFMKKGSRVKYLLFILLSWLLEWSAINNLLRLGFGRVFTVFLIMPFFALGSYLIQKFFVFR